MVSVSTLVAMVFTLLVCFGMPVVLAIWAYRKDKSCVTAVLFGTLGFIVPQQLIRIPLLQVLATQQWYLDFANNNFIMYAVILAFTAGLFETTGRLLVNKLFLKKRLSYTTGFAAGVGHGGIEAIGLVGMVYVNNIVLSAALNAGTLESMIGPELAATISQQLLSAPPYMFYIAGIERIMAITFHVAISVLLMSFMQRGKTAKGFWLCVAIHAAYDGAFILINQFLGMAVAYAALGTATVLAVLFLARQYKATRPKASAMPNGAEGNS